MYNLRVIKKRSRRFYFSLLLVLLLFMSLADMVHYHNRFYQGVYFKGIVLGGKSLEEVEEILENLEVTFSDSEEILYSIPLKKMGIIISKEQIINEGYIIGRQAPWPFYLLFRIQLKKRGAALPLHYHMNLDLLEQGIEELKKTFNSNPVNAHFKFEGNTITLVLEKQGYRINTEALIEKLLQNLKQEKEPFSIVVPLEILYPKVTALSLSEKGLTTQMSSFSSEFNPTATNRVHNIRLAAETLNNYILAPGEIFSLINVIGDTTAEKGYKEAPVIVGGELIPGLGGGLCQVSTTLYNAALLAELQILERHNHQLTVPYVPPGRDATVSFGTKDLKFMNNKEHFLQIISKTEEKKLLFAIIGSPMKERVEIFIREKAVFPPSIRYESAPELFQWEMEIIEGSYGYTVEVWKIVLQDNEEKSRGIISIDTYSPYPIVIRIGTKFSESTSLVPKSIRIIPALSP